MDRTSAPHGGADRAFGRRRLLGLLALAAGAAGCAGAARDDADDAGLDDAGLDDAGLARLAEDVLRSRDDLAPLLTRLRADLTDYTSIFVGDTVVAAIRHYDGYWRRPRLLGPSGRHTEYRFTRVTTEELLAGTAAAPTFPGGYRDVAPHLQPGLVLHRVTFHEPGQTAGIDLDALVPVGGRWRLLPTPWLVLRVDEPGHVH